MGEIQNFQQGTLWAQRHEMGVLYMQQQPCSQRRRQDDLVQLWNNVTKN